MIRGLLSGFGLGAVGMAAFGVVVSTLAPLPERPTRETADAERAAPSAPDEAADTVDSAVDASPDTAGDDPVVAVELEEWVAPVRAPASMPDPDSAAEAEGATEAPGPVGPTAEVPPRDVAPDVAEALSNVPVRVIDPATAPEVPQSATAPVPAIPDVADLPDAPGTPTPPDPRPGIRTPEITLDAPAPSAMDVIDGTPTVVVPGQIDAPSAPPPPATIAAKSEVPDLGLSAGSTRTAALPPVAVDVQPTAETEIAVANDASDAGPLAQNEPATSVMPKVPEVNAEAVANEDLAAPIADAQNLAPAESGLAETTVEPDVQPAPTAEIAQRLEEGAKEAVDAISDLETAEAVSPDLAERTEEEPVEPDDVSPGFLRRLAQAVGLAETTAAQPIAPVLPEAADESGNAEAEAVPPIQETREVASLDSTPSALDPTPAQTLIGTEVTEQVTDNAPVAEDIDEIVSEGPAARVEPDPQPETETSTDADSLDETEMAQADPQALNPGSGRLNTRVVPLTERPRDADDSGRITTDRLPTIEAMTDPAPVPEAPETEPEVATTDTAPSVTSEVRLPGVRAGSFVPNRTAPGQPAATASDNSPPAADQPALVRNAAPFDHPDGMPLLSIVLLDVGDAGVGTDLLSTFSFPVTIVVDPTRTDAPERAAAYARAGLEVGVLGSGLPEGAVAQDIEVTIGSHLAAIPEAAVLMDPAEEGFAGDRELATQVIDILNDTGHGLLLWDRGLNTARGLAERADHPTATIYRELDAERERETVILRYLDRAAFEAGRTGAVVMVGHSYPETVTALFQWALSSRAGRVALAPLSTVVSEGGP